MLPFLFVELFFFFQIFHLFHLVVYHYWRRLLFLQSIFVLFAIPVFFQSFSIFFLFLNYSSVSSCCLLLLAPSSFSSLDFCFNSQSGVFSIDFNLYELLLPFYCRCFFFSLVFFFNSLL